MTRYRLGLRLTGEVREGERMRRLYLYSLVINSWSH